MAPADVPAGFSALTAAFFPLEADEHEVS